MKTRTALVACTQPSEGAWAYVRGNEVGIHVTALNHGERVSVHLEHAGGIHQLVYDVPGTHVVDFYSCKRYRIGKQADPDAMLSPTTVEVVLNGTNQR